MRYLFIAISLVIASTPAAAQILPPIAEQPTEILQPPLGYPPTTALSAAGTYLAEPAWSQTVAPNLRFVILTNFGSHAVLDRETGLVWARQPTSGAQPSPAVDWLSAIFGCNRLTVGGKSGWRLPSAAELRSLVDDSIQESPGTLRLPAGHPFLLHPASIVDRYWTSEIFTLAGTKGITVNLVSGSLSISYPEITTHRYGALCVRGPQ